MTEAHLSFVRGFIDLCDRTKSSVAGRHDSDLVLSGLVALRLYTFDKSSEGLMFCSEMMHRSSHPS